MDSEKKSVNIPWLKVIGQGYIGGIAILIAFSWKFLLGLLVVAVGYYFIDGTTSEGRDSWVDLDLALRGLIGLFALSTFITVLGIFHMLFWYKVWARVVGLFVLFGFLYGLLWFSTGALAWGTYQCIMQIINGRALWGPIFGILIGGFFLYWFGRTCYYTTFHWPFNDSPNFFRWILKASQLKESIADLQKKADCGLHDPQKKEQKKT